MRRAALSLLLIWLAAPALAVQPDERLTDPAMEMRAREISRELRCLVCQNQNIDDSDAPLARDLRILVRERLSRGDTDAQVLDFVTQRYGDFVRLRPPVRPYTWILWFGPVVILVLAGTGTLLYLRNRRGGGTADSVLSAPLSPAEEARLDALLAESQPGTKQGGGR